MKIDLHGIRRLITCLIEMEYVLAMLLFSPPVTISIVVTFLCDGNNRNGIAMASQWHRKSVRLIYMSLNLLRFIFMSHMGIVLHNCSVQHGQ